MKVLYDYQAFQMQKVGGVSNCFAELIGHLPSSVEWQIGLKESDNVHLKEKGLLPNLPSRFFSAENFITCKHFLGKGTLFKWLNEHFDSFPSAEHKNKKYSIDLLKKDEYDIFHPTFFNPYFLPYIGNKPFVLTVHDFITDKFRGFGDWQTRCRRELAEKAAHIIAVSETTKEDAIDILHIPEGKISVIYHGVSISNKLQLKPVVGGGYFLFVGRRDGYKNFLPMVKAMVPFLRSHPSYKLVCTANDFNSRELTIFRDLGISHQLLHVFASYEELLSLYKYANAFIYPSLYEGFGIPILEAYAMKCPVLLSKESCFPEIAGDAALYFKLNDQENTLTALLDQFTNMSQIDRDSLIEKQNERLKRYSWEKSALQLAEVYELVLNERKV